MARSVQEHDARLRSVTMLWRCARCSEYVLPLPSLRERAVDAASLRGGAVDTASRGGAMEAAHRGGATDVARTGYGLAALAGAHRLQRSGGVAACLHKEAGEKLGLFIHLFLSTINQLIMPTSARLEKVRLFHFATGLIN